MRRSPWSLLAIVLACAPAVAAEPPDPAPLVDGDVTVASVRGMPVLVKRVPGAGLVAANLYVRGGARNWSQGDAGVEMLALATAASGGTTSLDKGAFARKLAAIGAQVRASSTEEYAALQCDALTATWTQGFALLIDAFLHPALPPSEIELQRRLQLSQIRHELENPDGQLGVIAHGRWFAGHPYAARAVGTVESVSKLDGARLAAHLAKLRETGRLMLIVVGDVDAAQVVAQARAAFSTLPRGAWRETPLPSPARAKEALLAVKRELATNYVESMFTVPGIADRDFATAMVAMSILFHREFEEVRTRRNLSYAPGAWMQWNTRYPRGYLYVTAVDPTATMQVMLDEARRLQREPVPEAELAGSKSQFLTEFLLSSETVAGQATLLADAQLFGGDWRLARRLPDAVRAVGAVDVQAFARQWIAHLRTVLLGDPAKLDASLVQPLSE